MLNSDWPIGTHSVQTLADPDMVESVTASMDAMWWDRPYPLTGVDIGAGSARLHLISSFGAQQDVELRINDLTTKLSRFAVDTRKPVINTWQDVNSALDRTGQAWVVSFQLNWPRYHSPNAGGWVMTIIKQVFGMLPRYR